MECCGGKFLIGSRALDRMSPVGLFLIALFTFAPAICHSWSSSPSTATVICNTPSIEDAEDLISDGQGGAICTWTASDSTVYAQRLDQNGISAWGANGFAVCSAAGGHDTPRLVSDGAGGAFIAWLDGRSYPGPWQIYAQRMSSGGAKQWATDGVLVASAPNAPGGVAPLLAPDGAGGAIMLWWSATGPNLQKISATGALQWNTVGVTVATTGTDTQVGLASDNQGGAYVAYMYGTLYRHIRMQHVNAAGSLVWGENGIAICDIDSLQTRLAMFPDGSGGALVLWEDFRYYDDVHGAEFALYGQRVNSSGSMLWSSGSTADGIALCPHGFEQRDVTFSPDGSGGAIATWTDYPSNTDSSIYAQRIGGNGSRMWGTSGVTVAAAAKVQYHPVLRGDGTGGAIVVWQDTRSSQQTWAQELYAQRLDATGATQWTANGVPVSTLNLSMNPFIVGDGGAGAIVAWSADIGSTSSDIFGAHLLSTGALDGTSDVREWLRY